MTDVCVVCPNGASIHSAKGEALEIWQPRKTSLSAQRANNFPGTVGPLRRMGNLGMVLYRGCALRLAIGWAFGPTRFRPQL